MLFLNCNEAMRVIKQTEDPVTRNLLNMAFVLAVKKTQLEKTEEPSCDFDTLFFVKVLKEFFSEHQVIAQTLAGEKVGAWFESE